MSILLQAVLCLTLALLLALPVMGPWSVPFVLLGFAAALISAGRRRQSAP